jgi:hypothetical protein
MLQLKFKPPSASVWLRLLRLEICRKMLRDRIASVSQPARQNLTLAFAYDNI